MIEQKDCEFVDLRLTDMPGLRIVTYGRDGTYKPRAIARPDGTTAYSAAWCDRHGEVKEWFDLCIQDTSPWQFDTDRQLPTVTNSILDHQWEKGCRSMAEVHPERVFSLPFEQHPAPVIWLTADGRSLLKTDEEWLLCTDDEVLGKNDLPAYSDTLHRYLWNQNKEAPLFVTAGPDSSADNPLVRQMSAVFGDAIPINPGGSLMALRDSFTLSLGDFIDIISNRSDPRHIREVLRTPVSSRNLQLVETPGIGGRNLGFFFQKNQTATCSCELLHLKLAALHGAFLSVASAIGRSSSPFFDLNIDSFGVSMPDMETSLPFLWGHHVGLQTPTQSVRIVVGDIAEPYFIPRPGLGNSLYRNPRVPTGIHGLARVRIRKTSEPNPQGQVILEGTLLSDESIHSGPLDLLVLEWVLPKLGHLRVYARIEGKNTLAEGGEYRFKSLPTKLPADLKDMQDPGKGILNADRVRFHLLPRTGTPCDLYSMGVIALRILINHPDGLAASIDDLLGLARKYRTRHGNENWSTGTESLFEFVKSGGAGPDAERLGPQWLTANSGQTAAEAFSEIPAPLWWAVIDFVSRLFPGEAKDSFRKGDDDFQPRAPQEVMVAPIAALESLLTHTRELLFGSPTANRELLKVVRRSKIPG